MDRGIKGRQASISDISRHPGVAKITARIDWDASASLTDGYGMTSITDSGTGDITLNFARAFANTNYRPVFSHGDNLAAASLLREVIYVPSGAASTSLQIQAFAAISTSNPTRNLSDPTDFSVAIFGDLL